MVVVVLVFFLVETIVGKKHVGDNNFFLILFKFQNKILLFYVTRRELG